MPPGPCPSRKCGPYILPHLRDPRDFIVVERPKVSFVTGKPECSSGAAFQSSTRVQKPDGTWTTVATGAWRCPYPKKDNKKLTFGSGPN